MRIAEADNTAKYWPNLGSQQSTVAETWPKPITKPIVTFTMSFYPVPKVEELESGSWTAHYWTMCHFYHGNPFWEWENVSSTQHRPVAVPKTSVGGQSLGQDWPPCAFRSYHFSNSTILATDLRHNFTNAGPVLGRIKHWTWAGARLECPNYIKSTIRFLYNGLNKNILTPKI